MLTLNSLPLRSFLLAVSGLRNSEPSMTFTHQDDKILVELNNNAEMRRDWQAHQVSWIFRLDLRGPLCVRLFGTLLTA